VREIADRARIEVFMAALAREATADVSVFLVGGTSAVLLGWRDSTMDVDLAMRPENDGMLRAIPLLKERLRLNVEFASPDLFIPVPAGWEARSAFVTRIGRVTFYHFDLYAQALAKVERGHTRDLADVRAMVERGLVDPREARAYFERLEPELYRFPALDAASFRAAVNAAFSG